MRILVTGGLGFIGGHLVDALVKLEHDVVVVDNNPFSHNERQGVDYYYRDISDINSISDLFYNVDYVFHLAAESRIQPAILNPSLAYRTNVLGTLNVLEASKKNKIKKVIYSSTSSVYGLTQTFPTHERCYIDCLNPYAHSKFLGEELFRQYSHEVSSIILRYFNVFGENSPINGPYVPVVGIFKEQARQGLPLTIVGDGSRRRDFVYVGDVVSANIVSMKSSIGRANVFNIGSGRNITIRELADKISTNQIHIPDREGEADNTLACIDSAKEFLKWEPNIFIEDWV